MRAALVLRAQDELLKVASERAQAKSLMRRDQITMANGIRPWR
jgi:hypothetical protein